MNFPMLPLRCLLLLVLWLLIPESKALAEKPDQPKEIDLVWGMKIPMRDGIALNATLYKPAASKTPVPTVFTMTPYISDTYHERGMYFSRNGYNFALVDCRGRGNSSGDFEPFVHDAHDGYDVVEWLAKQPWCDGKVAMWGGSYAGYNQWATIKEFPPHLATIVPAAAAHPGVDFPSSNGIFYSYDVQWLTFTSGRTPNAKLFGDSSYWTSKFLRRYQEHIPFKNLDALVGNPSPHFQNWLKHPAPDEYLDALAPTSKDYARFDIPILTITGHYDDDQPGAMTFYHRHMQHGSTKGRARHDLLIGPWDHAGTRTPTADVGGVHFDKGSLLDLNDLHKQWYDHTMKGGPRPKFLRKPVTYYVPGAEAWKYADSLEAIPSKPERIYLEGEASDVFHAGRLQKAVETSKPATYTYDPLDLHELVSPGEAQGLGVKDFMTDQRLAMEIKGNGLVYHSEPFAKPTEITGVPKLVAWIALDVPDTDFAADLFEIKKDGSSIWLTGDRLRARYRESDRHERFVKSGEIGRYEFQGFTFFSRRLAEGSRLRLVFYSPNSRFFEKNYNSGGDVAAESHKDARTAHVLLYQDQEHASYLELPTCAAN